MSEPGAADVRIGRAAHVLTITLARPRALNAVTTPMLDTVAAALGAAATDPDVRVVVLAGEGRAFCSGADLTGVDLGDDALVGGSTLDAVNRVIRAISEQPQPVVAAVHGVAAGVGCSLALVADLVVASEEAYFLLAFANVGLMPDGGATALVAAAVGRARAMRMALLAERVPAVTAAEWGLISHVVPAASFAGAVSDLTRRLAAGPTGAYARTKAAVNAAGVAALGDALVRERAGQVDLLGSADFAEGVAAFRDRRPARFGPP